MEQIEALKKLVKEAEFGDEFGIYADITIAEVKAIKWAIQKVERYEKALKEILEEGYEEAGLHPETGMQLDTFITKTANNALKD